MTDLNTWFERGMTEKDYIASMETNKESLEQILQQFKLYSEDAAWLQSLKEKELKALVLTADWCTDAMVNLPIFMKISKEAEIETRYFIRDENLELMDQYLTNGTARSIPIIVFIDQEGREVTKWGPRAPEVQGFADEFRSSMPAKDDPAYEAAFKAMVTAMKERFTTDKELWEHIKTDIIQTLQQAVR